jgi:hypothetical protein
MLLTWPLDSFLFLLSSPAAGFDLGFVVEMSQSSSWSCAGSRRRRESPEQYQEKPLQYEPPVFCYCGKKAPCWIS